VLYGGVHNWWGPGTVGYRYLAELSPVIVWLAAHAWRRQLEERARLGRLWRSAVATLAVAAVAASVLAHSTGAFDYDGSALRRGLRKPKNARLGPHGEREWVPYFDVVPQRIPLAYWGLISPRAAEPRVAEPVSDPSGDEAP
jgi:hypothetical protein